MQYLVEQKKRIIVALGLLVFVLVGWQVLAFYGIVASSDFPAVSRSQWQAVFLTNNQVYFGHLRNYNREYAALSNIYYLRITDPLQQGSPPQPQGISLVKLGAELHGPDDVMYIPKDKIMFWENLKPDSQVVQAINNANNAAAQEKK